jgi:uncharacterized membrane protein
MLTAAILLVCLGAGLIAGVFFAFSAFVMKALAQLPAEQGIRAMQQINVVVLNPLFLGVFVGTAVLSVVCFLWAVPKSLLLLAAAICYGAGSLGVTAAFNVPRNERLARLDAGSSEAGEYWPIYVREWLLWNHVRTVASAVSSALAAGALMY